MNNKLLAVLAVAVFLASGSVAVAAAPSDAEGEIPLGTVFVDADGEATVLLKFNETTYQGYSGYEFTLTAGKEDSDKILFYGKGGKSDANEIYNTSGNSFVLDGGSEETDKVTVSATGMGGVYTVKFNVGSTVDVGQYDVLIDLHVVASPVTGTTVELDDKTFKAVLNVTQNSNVTISYTDTIYAGEPINASLTVKYSGSDFARICIRVRICIRELSTVLNTDIASCTNILVDGVLECNVEMPLEANSYTASALDLLRWYFFSSAQARYFFVNSSRLMDVIKS